MGRAPNNCTASQKCKTFLLVYNSIIELATSKNSSDSNLGHRIRTWGAAPQAQIRELFGGSRYWYVILCEEILLLLCEITRDSWFSYWGRDPY